jgi:hypothetical protein
MRRCTPSSSGPGGAQSKGCSSPSSRWPKRRCERPKRRKARAEARNSTSAGGRLNNHEQPIPAQPPFITNQRKAGNAVQSAPRISSACIGNPLVFGLQSLVDFNPWSTIGAPVVFGLQSLVDFDPWSTIGAPVAFGLQSLVDWRLAIFWLFVVRLGGLVVRLLSC